jgi:hypothetical protein
VTIRNRIAALEADEEPDGCPTCGTPPGWLGSGLWLYGDGEAVEARREVACRLGISWPPERCPECQSPTGDWRGLCSRIWNASTYAEKKAQVK